MWRVCVKVGVCEGECVEEGVWRVCVKVGVCEGGRVWRRVCGGGCV